MLGHNHPLIGSEQQPPAAVRAALDRRSRQPDEPAGKVNGCCLAGEMSCHDVCGFSSPSAQGAEFRRDCIVSEPGYPEKAQNACDYRGVVPVDGAAITAT